MLDKPLSGIRVIEHGTFITGPAAGMLLADLGAEVIKVERPGTGDPFRAFKGGLYSPHFQSYNRNKKSIALDTKHPDDHKIFSELIKNADVYLHNFRPETSVGMKVDADTLLALNPDLVYCAISGFGVDGPYNSRPCYDSVAQASSGFMHLLLTPENPRIIGPAIADAITGFYAAYGILGALVRRGLRGSGAVVEVSMLEAMAHFNIDAFTHFFAAGDIMGPYSRPRASQSYALKCADGKWIAVHMSSPEKFWQGLAAVMNQPDLFTNPMFADRQSRLKNYEAIQDYLNGVFVQKPSDHWVQRLSDHDVPHARVYNIQEALSDPQFKFMQIEIATEHPVMGAFRSIRNPINFDGMKNDSVAAPPMLDEHRSEVLAWLDRVRSDDHKG